MKTNRKLMRKFLYVSVGGRTMGTMTIEKITSTELPDWHIYQFTRRHSVSEYPDTEFETHINTSTETVIDFPSYNEALKYWGPLESDYVADKNYRTDSPTHPYPPVAIQIQQTPIHTRNHKSGDANDTTP